MGKVEDSKSFTEGFSKRFSDPLANWVFIYAACHHSEYMAKGDKTIF